MKWTQRLLIFLFIVAASTVMVFLQENLDYKAKQREQYYDQVIYLPNPEYADIVALGYQNVLADYLHLWSIQFFSDKTDVGRFNVIYNVFDFITELDPRYIEAYRIGSIMMVKDVYTFQKNEKGRDWALKLLDKGIENNPDDWILPFEAAISAHFDFKDPKLAEKYYRKALSSDKLPEVYRKRIRTAIGSTMESFNKQDALSYWYDLWQNAEDEVVKNIAYAHFYDLKIDMDLDFFDRAISSYKKKYGVRPGKLQELIRKKIVPAMPYDPNGLPYKYDATTGEVSPPKGYMLKKKSGRH